MARRKRGALVLDFLIGLLAVLALLVLVRERLLPWIADRSVVDPGDAVQETPSLLDARSGDPVDVELGAGNLLVVFRSTCPACMRALPAWKRLAETGDWVTTAVGLEDRHAAAAYARLHLPTARAVVPADIHGFAKQFRISVVPTTLVIDREGRLVARRAGPLDASDVDVLRRHVDPSTP